MTRDTTENPWTLLGDYHVEGRETGDVTDMIEVARHRLPRECPQAVPLHFYVALMSYFTSGVDAIAARCVQAAVSRSRAAMAEILEVPQDQVRALFTMCGSFQRPPSRFFVRAPLSLTHRHLPRTLLDRAHSVNLVRGEEVAKALVCFGDDPDNLPQDAAAQFRSHRRWLGTRVVFYTAKDEGKIRQLFAPGENLSSESLEQCMISNLPCKAVYSMGLVEELDFGGLCYVHLRHSA